MTRRELIYDIERYCPFNEQEEKDKALRSYYGYEGNSKGIYF